MRKNKHWLFATLIAVVALFTQVYMSTAAPLPGSNPQLAAQAPTYAQVVAPNGYQPTFGVEAPNDNAHNALGVPDVLPNSKKGFVSLGHASELPKGTPDQPGFDPRLGCEGYLILEWKTRRIIDGPGDDIKVYEAGTNAGTIGFAEAIFVLVGLENGTWRYLGEFGTNKTTFDLGAGLKEPDPGKYKYVALCDKVDRQGGPPSGGPDIDAVAALNWTSSSEPAWLGRSIGAGNVVNGIPLNDGETTYIDEGAEIELPRELGFDVDCYEERKTFLVLSNLVFPEDHRKQARLSLSEAGGICSDDLLNAAEALSLTFRLDSGGLTVGVQEPTLQLTMFTESAFVTTMGSERYKLIFDPDDKVTTITAIDGPLPVTPANTKLAPFILKPRESVQVTADKVGQPYVSPTSFMPVAIGR